jgi:hypothetical protein
LFLLFLTISGFERRIVMRLSTKKRYSYLSQIVFLTVSSFIFSGCQKVINLDLNEASPVIVIEGLLNDRSGPFLVTISKSGSYFNQPVLPPVTGAEVIINENYGAADTLTETKPGIYLGYKIKGFPGRVYTLKVNSEDKEYIATSTMNSRVRIDSFNLTKSQFQHFGFDGGNIDSVDIDLNCYFKDPLEKNYYRFKVFKNDSARTQDYRLYDDQYANGQEIGLRMARVSAGDTFRIELHSIDKKTFGYYRSLTELIYSNPVFGSTPANPESNFSNGALGYFGASAVSSKTVIITDSLIKKAR